MQLSNLPLVKSPTKNASPIKRQGLEEVVKKSSKKVCILMDDCVVSNSQGRNLGRSVTSARTSGLSGIQGDLGESG